MATQMWAKKEHHQGTWWSGQEKAHEASIVQKETQVTEESWEQQTWEEQYWKPYLYNTYMQVTL